jgi:hypothetical protein
MERLAHAGVPDYIDPDSTTPVTTPIDRPKG